MMHWIAPLLSLSSALAAPDAPGDWADARAGDRVRYRYRHSSHERPPEHAPTDWAATLSVEVAAVEPGRAWLRLSVRSPEGEPLYHPLVGRDLLLPVSTDAGPPPPETPPGIPSARDEVVTAASRSWQTTRRALDRRLGDGPLETRHVAALEGSLYLADGLIRYEMVTSGFMAPVHTFQLELLDWGRGDPGAVGAVPEGVPLYAPPGAWYLERRLDSGGASLTRAEVRGWQGQIVTTTRRYFDSRRDEGEEDCLVVEGQSFCAAAHWSPQVESARLLDALLQLAQLAEVPWTASLSGRPAGGRRGELTLRGRPVATSEDARFRPGTYAFAADPWDPALEGLAFAPRVQPLRQSRRRGAGGETGEDVVDWGVAPPRRAQPQTD